jgi:S1-C subfamily serine protease
MKDKILLIILLAIFFGLMSGAIGAVFAKVYVLENAFNVPFLGQIEYLGNGYGGSNLVIRNPRNVTVEQNARIDQAIAASRESIVGIFTKKIDQQTTGSDKKPAGLPLEEDFYSLNNNLGQGFIITSDGWIVSSFIPPELKTGGQNSTSTLTSDYVVIDSNKDIYAIKQVVADPKLNLAYWQIRTDSLPVKNFTSFKNIQPGHMTISTGWTGPYVVSTVTDKTTGAEKGPIYSSDDFFGRFSTLPAQPVNSAGQFTIDLNGSLVGIVSTQGDIISAANFAPILESLFADQQLIRPKLGLTYLALDKTAFRSSTPREHKGAMIYPKAGKVAIKENGAADKAGLMAGDIIYSVNNIEINGNNPLNAVVAQFSPGQTVDIKFERNGEREQTIATLGPFAERDIK